jgi:hypothetical protein
MRSTAVSATTHFIVVTDLVITLLLSHVVTGQSLVIGVWFIIASLSFVIIRLRITSRIIVNLHLLTPTVRSRYLRVAIIGTHFSESQKSQIPIFPIFASRRNRIPIIAIFASSQKSHFLIFAIFATRKIRDSIVSQVL